MGALLVRPYAPEDAPLWNRFVAASRNGTFLFDRAYMDYHADRFTDGSLIFEAEGETVALFPANRRGDDLVSHGGLSYGGLVLGNRAGAADVLAMMDALGEHARAQGLARITTKTMPRPYHRQPAEEELYALFRVGARLIRRDIATAVPPGGGYGPSSMRARWLKKASKRADVTLGFDADYGAYWAILTERLGEKYAVQPTHSLAEITLLAERFPQTIRLFAAREGGQMQAGLVLFDCGPVLHAQYIAANAEGRASGLLDLTLHHAMQMAEAAGQWFSFGISTEEAGRVLNAGLIGYKESFGGRGIVHDTYLWEL